MIVRSWVLLVASWLSAVVALAGPLTRVANTTLKLPEIPGSFGYRLVEAFPGLGVTPVAITAPPGETNRLFFVEPSGRIRVLTDLSKTGPAAVFLDLVGKTVSGGEQGLLGLAFHPGHATNGRFFVHRTVTATTAGRTNKLHDRLSEFRVSANDPDRADPASEIVLFQQPDEAVNHNGGDLHFGPDGYLYVSLGDEGGGNDQFSNSQRIDKDFFAGLLRIDVDNRPGSLPPNPHPAVVGNYRVPVDNPFVGATAFNAAAVDPAKVRTEFFAVGLRNPWRFSFDPANGELWIGDVGQDRWESVVVTRKGANHGWAFREGNIAGPKPGMPAGFLTDPRFNYVPPVFVYTHGSGTDKGNSLTGGLVYRGSRLAQLHGAYVFADYVSGNVWALRRQASGAPRIERLLGKTGIAAFGTDPRNGDILLADVNGSRVWRLEYDAVFTGAPPPSTLADTGAFTDVASLTPAPGLVPYAINQPFWSDDATKRRWFSVPGTDRFLGQGADGAWTAPAGTVWMKHFDMEMTQGVPSSLRRIETRFLVRNTNGIHGLTYRWDSATNAVLVPEAGADETFTRVVDGVARTQTWRYPGRGECLACHNAAAGHALSFNPAQLDRDFPYPGGTTHQIAALADAGYFGDVRPAPRGSPPIAALDDESVSVEWRARSYLAVNCAPCHRPGGPGGGFFDARLETPTALAGLVDGVLNDARGDDANRVLASGSAAHSVVLQRQSVRGAGQMPPLASSIPDAAGSRLITRWIEQLASDPPATAATLTPVATLGGLRLKIRQPANQTVGLEAADRVDAAIWVPVATPEPVPSYPATAREIEVTPPVDERTRFFRTRSSRP